MCGRTGTYSLCGQENLSVVTSGMEKPFTSQQFPRTCKLPSGFWPEVPTVSYLSFLSCTMIKLNHMI